jgi:3D (Asp-Asp-Asp) domain-containing protein
MASSSSSSLRELGSELIAALLRVLDRVAGRITGGLASACAMLGIAVPGLAGCQESEAQAPSAPIVVAAAPDAAPVPDPDKELGEFRMTFYYVIGEDEATAIARRQAAKAAEEAEAAGVATAANDSVLAAAIEPSEPEQVTLYNRKDCSSIAEVSREFADAIALQGTGKLRDGRVINVSGRCKCGDERLCYAETGREWGNAGTGRALNPFRTVAVDPKQVKLGSLLYIPALDGLMMPGRAPTGGWKHDGCVAADDTGGGIDGMQLDLFVGRRAFYLSLARRRGSHGWAKHVRVLDGKTRCERKGGVVRRVGTADGPGAI